MLVLKRRDIHYHRRAKIAATSVATDVKCGILPIFLSTELWRRVVNFPNRKSGSACGEGMAPKQGGGGKSPKKAKPGKAPSPSPTAGWGPLIAAFVVVGGILVSQLNPNTLNDGGPSTAPDKPSTTEGPAPAKPKKLELVPLTEVSLPSDPKLKAVRSDSRMQFTRV